MKEAFAKFSETERGKALEGINLDAMSPGERSHAKKLINQERAAYAVGEIPAEDMRVLRGHVKGLVNVNGGRVLDVVAGQFLVSGTAVTQQEQLRNHSMYFSVDPHEVAGTQEKSGIKTGYGTSEPGRSVTMFATKRNLRLVVMDHMETQGAEHFAALSAYGGTDEHVRNGILKKVLMPIGMAGFVRQTSGNNEVVLFNPADDVQVKGSWPLDVYRQRLFAWDAKHGHVNPTLRTVPARGQER